jgi:hypothetical protein
MNLKLKRCEKDRILTMVVKLPNKKKIEEFIEKGGKTKADNTIKDVLKFNVCLPRKIADMIDKNREERIDKVSRHHWIIEAIMEKLGI